MRTWASTRVVKISPLRHSSRSLPLKDSTEPFSQGLPWLDEEGGHADAGQPGADRVGRELRAVIGAQIGGRPALDEELGEAGQHVIRPQAAGDDDGEALAGVLVHDAEQPQRPPVVGPILDEVVRPDVVGAGGPPPRGCAVRQPQPPAPWRLRGHAQPLAAPAPLDPFVVHAPALGAQQGGDATVAIAPEALRQGDDPRHQGRLIRGRPRGIALRVPCLPQDATRPTLRDVQGSLRVADCLAPARRA